MRKVNVAQEAGVLVKRRDNTLSDNGAPRNETSSHCYLDRSLLFVMAHGVYIELAALRNDSRSFPC